MQLHDQNLNLSLNPYIQGEETALHLILLAKLDIYYDSGTQRVLFSKDLGEMLK